jgi:hypothetical protein
MYEDLVRNPENILNEVYNFLGVSYENNVLAFQKKKKFRHGHEILDTIHQYLERPITTNRVNRSYKQLSSEQLELLRQYLAPEINYLPYTYLPNKIELSPGNQMRLIVAKFAFGIRWFMLEEHKNKFRFQLHYLAIRFLRNSPLKSFIFKNLIYKNEPWKKIRAESSAETN